MKSATKPASKTGRSTIKVTGAREHNLKSIDVEIPTGQLVVVTGVSGSGKSSLLFDTLFHAGRTQFLQSLARRAKRAFPIPAPPAVDRIEGLPPVLALSQERGRVSSRATLLSLADLARPLRLLYSRLGKAFCPNCGESVSRQSVDEVVQRMLRLEERRKVMILAPIVRQRKGAHRAELEQLAARGYVRVRIDGILQELAPLPQLNEKEPHSIEVVIDRIMIKAGIEDRVTDSVRLALREGDETCLISAETSTDWEDRLYSSRYACADCDLSFPPLESRSFSPQNPAGQCVVCEGWGTDSESEAVCKACAGTGLNPFSRNVTFNELAFPELLAMSVNQACEFFSTVKIENDSADEITRRLTQVVLPEVRQRLELLQQVGLGYLTLDRAARTLSGGEFQRTRLAAVLSGGLVGVAYLLDEPTSGLHQSDAERLLELLQNLRDRGNSLLVVEHDLTMIAGADHLVELGPGAGVEGGHLIAAGTPAELKAMDTPTGRALSGSRESLSADRAPAEQALKITGATKHNLQGLDIEIPLGRFVCLTGVSESGKSTLVHEVLVPSLRRHFDRKNPVPVACTSIAGCEQLFAIRVVDQTPLGRSGRSNPATATGLWTEIRRIFSGTREAKVRGFGTARFSLQNSAGRCALCKGRGERIQRMPFLPAVRTRCPECRGRRFNDQTLAVTYKGLSVADVFELSLSAAREFFASFPVVSQRLDVLCELGLGYLKLGQPAPTLSGGESQRIKLAAELGKISAGPTLFILDEPTSGLHPADIAALVGLLQKLIDEGHSVLVIEHQLDVIAAADSVLDLGPGAGPEGGKLVASGTPEELAKKENSQTGRSLKNRV